MGQYDFKKVEQFEYLGTIVSPKNDCQIEIKQKIKIGNKSFYALGNSLSSRFLSIEVKNQLEFDNHMKNNHMYGSQC